MVYVGMATVLLTIWPHIERDSGQINNVLIRSNWCYYWYCFLALHSFPMSFCCFVLLSKMKLKVNIFHQCNTLLQEFVFTISGFLLYIYKWNVLLAIKSGSNNYFFLKYHASDWNMAFVNKHSVFISYFCLINLWLLPSGKLLLRFVSHYIYFFKYNEDQKRRYDVQVIRIRTI